MFKGLPEQFGIAYTYILSLDYMEAPDYDYLLSLFDSIVLSPNDSSTMPIAFAIDPRAGKKTRKMSSSAFQDFTPSNNLKQERFDNLDQFL